MIDQALQLFFALIAQLMIQCVIWMRPALPIICGAIAWVLPVMIVWHVFTLLHTGIANVRQLHRIPCARCRYATDDYHLKCPVNPTQAFSEQAIACTDFESDFGPEQRQSRPPSSSTTKPAY